MQDLFNDPFANATKVTSTARHSSFENQSSGLSSFALYPVPHQPTPPPKRKRGRPHKGVDGLYEVQLPTSVEGVPLVHPRPTKPIQTNWYSEPQPRRPFLADFGSSATSLVLHFPPRLPAPSAPETSFKISKNPPAQRHAPTASGSESDSEGEREPDPDDEADYSPTTERRVKKARRRRQLHQDLKVPVERNNSDVFVCHVDVSASIRSKRREIPLMC